MFREKPLLSRTFKFNKIMNVKFKITYLKLFKAVIEGIFMLLCGCIIVPP